jgi:integrase
MNVELEPVDIHGCGNLAQKQGRLTRVPYVPSLREDNVRQGFFLEAGEFEAVASHLPEDLADIARFGYLVGWRKSEILGLAWEMVDRQGREIRLLTSKNGWGRVLPIDGKLWDLIEKRYAARQVHLLNGSTELARLVFHVQGKPIGDFRKAWATACRKAGIPGKLFHDLRRTAVRNMIRAGVPERVAMEISGHRTRAVFDRYNIVSTEDKRRALLKKTQAHLESLPKAKTFPPNYRTYRRRRQQNDPKARRL